MTVKTFVINKSDRALKLKEGTGGVYRLLKELKERTGTCTIKCDTNATFSEYWVGTGLESDDNTVLTITSDDCWEYQTINIINDPDDRTKLKLENVRRGVTETAVVNNTKGIVKVKVRESGSVVKELKKDEKFVIKNDCEEAKRCTQYTVESVSGIVDITTKDVAKAQRINIFERSTTVSGQATLDMDIVYRYWHLTEVINKTGAAITVTPLHKGNGVVGETLQKDDHYTIKFDPKNGGRLSLKYSVEYSSPAAGTTSTVTTKPVLLTHDNFAGFERIDIVTKGGNLEFEVLEPRASPGTSKASIFSRIWRGITGFF